MAEELTWETLAANFNAGNNPENNLANFENTTKGMIFIRDIDLWGSFNGMDAGDSAELELSKSATNAVSVNGDSTFRIHTGARSPEHITAGATDGGHFAQTDKKYAKGQLTLKPGETLFMNKSGDISGQGKAVIGYHF